jgi:hypothetical protein
MGIVFFSRMAQGVPSMGPVQRLCGGTFVSDRPETVKFFKSNYPELKRALYRRWIGPVSSGHRYLKEAKVVVSGARHEWILRHYEAKRVMLFHGTYRSLSEVNLAELEAFCHVLLNGPRMEKQLKRLGREFPFSYTVSGYVPFTEFPEPDEATRVSILEGLGLDAACRTVLYVPARRDCGSWVQCAEAIASQLPANVNLVMRPHPNQALHGNAEERRLYRKLRKMLAERGRGVVDLGQCSFPELMCVADVLIGDATSPNEEFLIYDRPHIITETYTREQWLKTYRETKMHKDDIDDLMSLYDTGFSYAKGGFRDWAHAVETAFAEPDRHAALRRSYFAYAFGEEVRSAADRAAGCLTRLHNS